MDIRLIKLFDMALSVEDKVDAMKIVPAAGKVGYLVHPDCYTKSVLEYVRSLEMNPNSTFYKDWNDIADRTRLELLIDQVRHYASTYGTNFSGEVYNPNKYPVELNYKLYKVIVPCTYEELYDKCICLLNSGCALSQDTLEAVVDYVVDCVKNKNFKLNLDDVANRDAMCILSDKLGILPTTGQNIVRALFYKVFGTPSMIMSKENINILYRCHVIQSRCIQLNLTDEQMIALSEVFLRYKKFLLAFKDYGPNRPVINKLRQLAKKYHKPMNVGFWERLTQEDYIHPEEIYREVDKLDNNFKIVRLIQMLQYRKIQNQTGTKRIFIIRNGKSWVDHKTIYAPYNGEWDMVIASLIGKLIQNMQAKFKSIHNGLPVYVKFPTQLKLTCPVSEKKFFGNIPFGSSIQLANKDNYFGIYWRNEWGTRDYDLSYIDECGAKYGWNANYKSNRQNILYSGDMTSADPQATEIMLARGTTPIANGLIKVNRYSGDPGSKLRLFIGQDECKDFGLNYMVDPNSIMIQEDTTAEQSEMVLGCIYNMQFYFNMFMSGNNRVSIDDPAVLGSIIDMAKSYLPLRPILLKAGFTEYTKEHAERGIEVDIDLTDLKKDTLIELFS